MKFKFTILWTVLIVLALAPLVVTALAMAQGLEDREVVSGAEGTALARALKDAGVTVTFNYEDGAIHGLSTAQLVCDAPGFVRHAYCEFIDQNGYPDRRKSLRGQRAVDLMAALFEVNAVLENYPEGDHLEVAAIGCEQPYERDFSCVLEVR